MNTTEPEQFDYQGTLRRSGPPPGQERGHAARQARRAVAKERITIRIDQDVLERFKDLSPEGQGYQSLINEALREWLSARGVKELIREELEVMTEKVLSAVRGASQQQS
jgi:uncharacterized protein (DUF4415 family)